MAFQGRGAHLIAGCRPIVHADPQGGREVSADAQSSWFMPYADRRHHRIWYEASGESGAPVLLIMGLSMRGAAWQHQVEALSTHHRVAVFDHHGVGESSPLGARRLTMRGMANDAIAVLDALGWQQAHIVGISMGGMIAQNLAVHAPQRVLSLALAATHPGGARSFLPTVPGISLLVRSARRDPEARLRALGRLLFTDDFCRANPERARELLLRDLRRPPPSATLLAQIAAIAGHHTAPALQRFEAFPTLVLRAGKDRLIDPRHSDRLHALIPGSRLLRFDDSGHLLTRQCADRFNAALFEHLA